MAAERTLHVSALGSCAWAERDRPRRQAGCEPRAWHFFPADTPALWPLWLVLRRIENACLKTIAEAKYLTMDLGGKATCSEYTKAIIGNMQG